MKLFSRDFHDWQSIEWPVQQNLNLKIGFLSSAVFEIKTSMLTTCYVDGAKISIDAFKKEDGKVALCAMGHKLVAKKGKKVVHHFAHAVGEICDPWRGGMTNWHSQWQAIVADKANVEVCLDVGGNITGHSSFHGAQRLATVNSASMGTNAHIADIIKPSPPGYRPLVVELQHSSMNKETIEEREKYYAYMIWVFDFTPRVVSQGKHNKIAFVDGVVNYLKEKVSYLGLISCRTNLSNVPGYQMGDQCLSPELMPIGGLFLIVNTKTKYFKDSTAPTYYDTGFCMLRLLFRLDKGLLLTLMISYDEFFRERMPPLDAEKLKTCRWFQSIDPLNLIKIGLLPKCIDVDGLWISVDRVAVRHNGIEFQDLGFERGIDEWHWGPYYEKIKMAELKAAPVTAFPFLAGLGVKRADPTKIENNVQVLFFTKLKHFLGSPHLEMEVIAKKGGDLIIVYCDHTTYGLKDHFTALGMTFRKGKNTFGGSKSTARKGHQALVGAINEAIAGAPAPRNETKDGQSKTHWRGLVKDVQAKLNSSLA